MSIISNTTDLEQQCEDSLFEVCDSRERYPQQCATELEKCIKLTNEIHMTKVLTTSAKVLDVPSLTNEHFEMLQRFSDAVDLLKTQEPKLQEMIEKIENLTACLNQIKRDKISETNKLLQD